MKYELGVLKGCPFFYNIAESNLESLLTCLLAQKKTYPKESYVYRAGESVEASTLFRKIFGETGRYLPMLGRLKCLAKLFPALKRSNFPSAFSQAKTRKSYGSITGKLSKLAQVVVCFTGRCFKTCCVLLRKKIFC